MNSREKLDTRLQEAQTAQPETEQEAMLAQLLQVAGPMVGPMVPEDPTELDEQLLRLSKWLVSMRSDDAELEASVFVRARAADAPAAGGGAPELAEDEAPRP